MRRIEILAFPDVQLLDIAGPLQVFASANDRYRAWESPRIATPQSDQRTLGRGFACQNSVAAEPPANA
jgi:transcriptional regulator GlxA family with amidase domain